MLNAKEMQLQALETIGEYLQSVCNSTENEELIWEYAEEASKKLFQIMTAARDKDYPIWYLKEMARGTVFSTHEERNEAIEELKERKYNEVPTDEEYRKALRDMIDNIESAAYDLLKTCGIYSRIPVDEYDSACLLSDFSGEVENSTRGILEAIINTGEPSERFLFSLFWDQIKAPEDQDSPDQQAND